MVGILYITYDICMEGHMKSIKKMLFVVLVLISLVLMQTIQSGFIMYKVATENGIFDTIDMIREEEGYVHIEDISDTFVEAVVSIEDHRFYDHDGVDIISITRALYTNLRAGGIVSGGSTITQQLAKNLFLTFEKNYDRKIAEVFIAKELEDKLSKDEILELYVNVINYGDGSFGIGSASQNYFLKDPNELTKAEAIILAGIPQSPSRFNLTYNFEKAMNRSHQVINAMISQDVITISESKVIINEIRGLE